MWTHAVGKGGEEDKNRNEASPSIKLKKGGGGSAVGFSKTELRSERDLEN